MSVATLPPLLWVAERVAGHAGLLAVLGAGTLGFLVCVASRIRGGQRLTLREPRAGRLLLWLSVGFAVMVFLSLVDLDTGTRLYATYARTDHAKHVAVIASLAESGCPPVNPFYAPGEPQRLFYYYQWHLLGTAVKVLGAGWLHALDARTAAATWTTLALCATIALYVRHRISGARHGTAAQRGAVAISLLAIAGIDIIPWAILAANGRVLRELDWWNEQVAMWVGQLVWVPQHVAGLVAAVWATLLLRRSLSRRDGERALMGALAGLALAATAGMSVYVFLSFALCLLAWLVAMLLRRDRRAGLSCGVAAAVAFVLVLPFALELVPAKQFAGSGVSLEVRQFFPLRDALDALGYEVSPYLHGLLHALALPVSYALELGFFALAGVWYARRRYQWGKEPSHDRLSEACMVLVPLILCSVARSTIENNDLAWRGLMPMQFVLLIWGARFAEGLGRFHHGTPYPRALRGAAICTLVLGVLGSVVEVASLRFTQPLRDLQNPAEQVGLSVRSARLAWEWVRANTPRDAVVQVSRDIPPSNGERKFFYRHELCMAALYSDRVLCAGDRVNLRCFGREDPAMLADLDRLFATPDWNEAVEIARRWGIDYFVADTSTPAWADPSSWVWTVYPVFEASHHRVFSTP